MSRPSTPVRATPDLERERRNRDAMEREQAARTRPTGGDVEMQGLEVDRGEAAGTEGDAGPIEVDSVVETMELDASEPPVGKKRKRVSDGAAKDERPVKRGQKLASLQVTREQPGAYRVFPGLEWCERCEHRGGTNRCIVAPEWGPGSACVPCQITNEKCTLASRTKSGGKKPAGDLHAQATETLAGWAQQGLKVRLAAFNPALPNYTKKKQERATSRAKRPKPKSAATVPSSSGVTPPPPSTAGLSTTGAIDSEAGDTRGDTVAGLETHFRAMSADLSNLGNKNSGLDEFKATIRAEVAEQVKASVNEALQPVLAALGKEREGLQQERLALEKLHAALQASLDKTAH